MNQSLLEIACFDISSAIIAVESGADRIELCDNPAAGGTTPSSGTIKSALEKIHIPVFPIIRPRGGDFLYNDDEFEVMMWDVQMCRQLNCKGIVTGLLKKDGSIDINRTRLLLQAAGPMEVTFHRAFDQAYNPQQALEDIIATGCTRLLTSGQKQNAVDGKQLIKELIIQAANRIIIMPGGGVRSNNISYIAEYTNTTEFHSSARIQVPSGMNYISQGIKEDLAVTGVEKAEIVKMKTALENDLLRR